MKYGDGWYIQSDVLGRVRRGLDSVVQEKAWPGRNIRMKRMEAAMMAAIMMKRSELGPLDCVRCSIALLQMIGCETRVGCGSSSRISGFPVTASIVHTCTIDESELQSFAR